MTSLAKSLTKVFSLSAVALTLITNVTPVLAHDDAYLDTLKSANGGQLRMAGIYHFELVMVKDSKEVKDNQILVYVTDHGGTKITTTGATATATILAGKVKTTANLVADGENRLKGVAKYASGADAKVVLSVNMAGKSTEQARFTPFTLPKDEHVDHKH
ncbi:hypothetical protein [Undibacterium sp. Ren11W]|uniref:hypothetical protein n=1 Tax=Undibacterium sp. Ren11W TaxID=3413045 RepID=UPI003BF2D64A